MKQDAHFPKPSYYRNLQAFDLSTIPRHSTYTYTLKALLKGHLNGTIMISLQLDYLLPAFLSLNFYLQYLTTFGCFSSLIIPGWRVQKTCSLMNICLAHDRPSFTEWSWQFLNTCFSDVSLLIHLSLVLYIPHLHW